MSFAFSFILREKNNINKRKRMPAISRSKIKIKQLIVIKIIDISGANHIYRSRKKEAVVIIGICI